MSKKMTSSREINSKLN